MKSVTIILSMLRAMTCSSLKARTVARCYDSTNKKFCVRMDGQQMTVEEYDNWLYENQPSAYVSDTILAYWMKRHLGNAPSTQNINNYRNFTFATRTIKWGGKQLIAWAVIDDTGRECSHWVFAGSANSNGGRWWLEDASLDRVNVTLVLCADTFCWTWGYLDENGKPMMWIGSNALGEELYIPWDWNRIYD